jgi:hypothetical protein
MSQKSGCVMQSWGEGPPEVLQPGHEVRESEAVRRQRLIIEAVDKAWVIYKKYL